MVRTKLTQEIKDRQKEEERKKERKKEKLRNKQTNKETCFYLQSVHSNYSWNSKTACTEKYMVQDIK